MGNKTKTKKKLNAGSKKRYDTIVSCFNCALILGIRAVFITKLRDMGGGTAGISEKKILRPILQLILWRLIA